MMEKRMQEEKVVVTTQRTWFNEGKEGNGNEKVLTPKRVPIEVGTNRILRIPADRYFDTDDWSAIK